MRISGGQRKRVGIPKAFYKLSDGVFLNKATSALDEKTGQAVMKALETLDKDITLFIIAHRLTTLKNCDLILEFKGNHSIQTLSYE